MAALELAEVTSASGKSYKSIVHNCIEKQATSKKLNSEIKKKEKEVITLNQEHHDKVELYTSDLKTITNAVETAQAMFEQQTGDLMYQKALTFDEVNIVSAILNTELGKIELNQENIQQISKQISEIGSLTVQKKNLEEKMLKLEAEFEKMTEEHNVLGNSIDTLQKKIRYMDMEVLGRQMTEKKLDAEINAKEPELKELKNKINEANEIIYQAYLIVAFLIAPKSLKEQHLDNLIRSLVALKMKYTGMGLNKVMDANGNVICECPIPVIDNLTVATVDMDSIRTKLALNLIPLVQDQFVYKMQHQIEMIKSHTDGEKAMLNKLGHPSE